MSALLIGSDQLEYALPMAEWSRECGTQHAAEVRLKAIDGTEESLMGWDFERKDILGGGGKTGP